MKASRTEYKDYIQKKNCFSLLQNLKMFKPDKPKNAFLQKKNQEKVKAADQIKSKHNLLKIQNYVRAFLHRQIIDTSFQGQDRVKVNIIMKMKLGKFEQEQISKFVDGLGKESRESQMYFFTEFIIQNALEKNCTEIAINILNNPAHHYLLPILVSRTQFAGILSQLFLTNKAQSLINGCNAQIRRSGILMTMKPSTIQNFMLYQFRQSKMEVQNENELTSASSLLLIETLFNLEHQMRDIEVGDLTRLTIFYIDAIKNRQISIETQRTVCYLFEQILNSGIDSHEEITKKLMKDNEHIIKLIDDLEMLEEIQSKLRRDELMEEFTNSFLANIRTIMTHRVILTLFNSGKHALLSQTLLKMVNQLAVLFQDRKLIFIREIISSDSVLTSLASSRDPMFREGLKMRLLAMDDPEFKALGIFSMKEWHQIIKSCVEIADIKIQKMAQKNNKQGQVSLIPFKKRNKDEIQFKTSVDLLSNLYKKVLRTNKFQPEIFVNYNLSGQLQHFLFGKGAVRIEHFLKQLPFLFSFESRMGKFKQFVKTDKTYHDRTLFLQQQVDDDLIIAVRRGHQFMDAFQACMTRDLRKKYKIIFFNQQGLEQQGVDGGGIIKEFINRVLKSGFSQTYSLFMDTPLNEIIPNPYSPSISQYEFIGKLIGKAVYQGINIEQKFAQPFLNLLIGRQNTFEDLQFIDKEIYRNLLSLKNSQEDISQLYQTFVIFDTLPNGQKKYIDLLCPSKPPSTKDTFVTNENKMDFIMAYADFKCNKQVEQKTRMFRKGFTKVIKQEWLTMFSNQELNSIISGSNPDFNVEEMRESTVLKDYHQKDETITYFWQVLREMNCEDKSLLLLYITSCSRPPTLGFASMKPKICICLDNDATHLPTANTCMNVLRLPNYKNKALLKKKLTYAINAKAGFQFA